MFDAIRTFLQELGESEKPSEYVHSRKQLAEAVLMYHVIAIDGVIRDEERQRMAEVLGSHFGLDEAETRALAQEAREAEHEAVDLYQFTSILKNSLEEEDRIQIIEHLWEMVFADGVVHELEDNVVWRVSELLGVDTRDRMALKRKVWKRSPGLAQGEG